MQSPAERALHARGASKQHAFVRKVMPGERVVWIPPERLCTGTKGWKRSAVALEIGVGGWREGLLYV